MNALRTSIVTALTIGLAWLGTQQLIAGPEDIQMTQDEKAVQDAVRKNPAWKPALAEIAQISLGKKGGGSVLNYCLNKNGDILACCTVGADKSEIRVFSPDGKQTGTWPVAARLQAICVDKSGAIFTAGSGKIMRLDQSGKVIATAVSPVANEPVVIGADIEQMLKDMKRQNDAERKKMKDQLEKRRAEFTGIAVTDKDVFVCVPAPSDFSYRVYRLDHDLKDAKLIVEKLRGCCGQMDIQAHEGNLWVPHNARHRIQSHDRDGKEIAQFGKTGKVKPEEFGGCCEPKNLRFSPAGDVIVAESGPPTCLKRFSKDGKFLGVVALVPASKGDCVRVTVEVSPDGKRYYLLDTTRDTLRVFGTKG